MAKGKHKHAGGPVRNMSREDYIKRIERNGITAADMEKNYKLGYDRGYTEGVDWAYDAAYGSLIMALRREFGFGHDRIGRLAMAAAEIQVEYMTNEELFDQLKKECGVDLVRMRDVTAGGGV